MLITPIRNDSNYRSVLSRVKELWNAPPNTPESDELDVLVDLVEAYERRHFSIDDPDPIVAITVRMEELGLKRKDLEPYIGSRSRVSEILNRRRALTLAMIRKLSELLGLPAEVLMKPYPLAKGSKDSTKYKRAS